MPKSYFIGNVLNPAYAKGDATFDFTDREARDLDLDGVPIHVEHAPGLRVGKVVSHWQEGNGSKWIMAEVDNDTLESKFANRSIRGGQPLYGGLSLKHVWRLHPDGTTSKRAQEVSICAKPARPGCGIMAVNEFPGTRNGPYKQASSDTPNMSTETPDQTPTETTNEPVVADEAEAPPSLPEPSAMAQMLIDMRSQMDSLNEELVKSKAEAQEYRELKEREEKEAAEKAEKAGANLASSVMDQWKELTGEAVPADAADALAHLNRTNTELVGKVLEIAHAASAKGLASKQQLREFQTTAEKTELQRKFHAAMQNKIGGFEQPKAEPTTVVHAASTKPCSKKRALDTGTPAMWQAIKNYRPTGSRIETMNKIAGLRAQRRKPFS